MPGPEGFSVSSHRSLVAAEGQDQQASYLPDGFCAVLLGHGGARVFPIVGLSAGPPEPKAENAAEGQEAADSGPWLAGVAGSRVWPSRLRAAHVLVCSGERSLEPERAGLFCLWLTSNRRNWRALRGPRSPQVTPVVYFELGPVQGVCVGLRRLPLGPVPKGSAVAPGQVTSCEAPSLYLGEQRKTCTWGAGMSSARAASALGPLGITRA